MVIAHVCARVSVVAPELREYLQRIIQSYFATSYLCWSYQLFLLRLLSELGYRLIPDSQSRAVSVIHLDDDVVVMETDTTAATEEALTQEQLVELTMKHAKEMKKLQTAYE